MATKKSEKSEPIGESAHRIWLAGLGALATVEEEGGRLFKDLVAKGEGYGVAVRNPVRSAQGRVRETVKSVRSRAGKTVERLEATFDQRIQDVLHRIGVPSREEIADLSARVERLTESVTGSGGPSAKAKSRRGTAKKAALKKTAKKGVTKKTARKTAKKKTTTK